jgi:hypothetical protein
MTIIMVNRTIHFIQWKSIALQVFGGSKTKESGFTQGENGAQCYNFTAPTAG